jgi:hypothetical protein
MDAEEGLRASDRHRLVGADGGPDSALVTKERMTHLQGAFDELSDVHTRVLVMRELEGMSYREIGQKLDLTRPAVESALFRARRRLESEYTELSEGRRCEAMQATIARMAEGTQRGAEEHRLARHVKRCSSCLRMAREQGIEPLTKLGSLRKKVAALLPVPWFFRRSGDGGGFLGLSSTGANAAPLAERAAALVAAAALVGAGGAALGGGALRGDRATAGEDRHAIEQPATVRGESQRGTAGPATDGERAGARRASGRKAAGPAGGRAGDPQGGGSGTANGDGTASPKAPSGGSGGDPVGDTTKSLPSLPGTPQAPRAPAPSTEIELGTPRIETPAVPGVPQVEVPEVQLPPVQVPNVQVPSVDGVTGEVENVTGELGNVLP